MQLLAPNGKPSNLTPEQYRLVRTPAFKKWFGDWENSPKTASKVVDSNGEPKLKWRGDNNPKNVFDYINYGNYGIYYFGDKDYAENYGNKINSYFINSKNPFIPNKLNEKEEKEIRNILKKESDKILIEQVKQRGFKNLYDYLDNYYLIEEGFNEFSNPLDILMWQLKNGINYFILEMSPIIEWIKNNDYDGFESYEGNNDNIAVFNSSQIKLADGTNTTFDSSNPDIRYNNGGKILETEETEKIKNKIKEYLKKQNLIDDEKLRYWRDMEVGDTINVTNPYELPESQVLPDSGTYKLKIIPIFKTDHYLRGAVNRDAFAFDDYDGWQTENINKIKKTFDTERREPIIVYENQDGLLTVLDGHHRIVVANELGRKSILALVTNNYSENIKPFIDSIDSIVKRYIKIKSELINIEGKKISDINFVNKIDEIINNPTNNFELGGIYHGSPFNFSYFSTKNMGSGEGNQKYGWGLYFTEVKDIAKRYALVPNENSFYIDGISLSEYDMPEEYKNIIMNFWRDAWELGYLEEKEKYIQEILYEIHSRTFEIDEEDDSVFDKETIKDINQSIKDYKYLYQLLSNSDLDIKPYIYHVTINKNKFPEDYDFIEWNNKITDRQLEKIFNGAEKIGGIDFKNGWFLTSDGLYNDRGYPVKGEEIYHWIMQELGSDKKASEFLFNSGIDGISYPAGMSTYAYYDEKGTNYVVFDESVINIDSVETYKEGGYVRLSKTPAPKKDRIYGSKKNKPKSAESSKKASGIELSDSVISSIKSILNKQSEQNPNKKVPLSTAKAVVRRGMGAYSSTHRPTIKGGKPNSRVAWGLARLNAFIYKINKGKSKSGRYHQDDDLIKELGYKVSKLENGGYVTQAKEIYTINEIENILNRKLDLWNESFVYIDNKKYQKVFLRNEFKIVN